MNIKLSRLAMSFIGVTCLLCVAATGCKNQESSGESRAVAAKGPENSAEPGNVVEAEVPSTPPTKEPASAPAVAPPPAPPKGRPSYMPCIVTVGSRENISEVYNLGYDDAGRLVRTTRQLTAGQCPTLNKKCRDFLDSFASKDMATDYTYDDTGRLSKVIRSFGQGRSGVLSLTYSPDGHMASYEYRETLENGSKNHHAGTINYGADGRVAGVSERGQVFAGGMQDTIRTFSAVAGSTDSPYAGAVVVWPFQIETPYLGWAAANGSYQLGRIKIDVTEKYEFGPDGRITAMTQSDNDGGSFTYAFAYDGCPSAASVGSNDPSVDVDTRAAKAMNGSGKEYVMGHGSGGMGFRGAGSANDTKMPGSTDRLGEPPAGSPQLLRSEGIEWSVDGELAPRLRLKGVRCDEPFHGKMMCHLTMQFPEGWSFRDGMAQATAYDGEGVQTERMHVSPNSANVGGTVREKLRVETSTKRVVIGL